MGAKTRKLSQINDSLIEWQSVVVADGSTGLTAVAGRGYFINTTGGAITVTLPTSPKTGDIVQLKDYARTWATNAVTIASTTLDGATNNPSFSTNGQTVTLVYMDNTRGWSLINEDTTTGLGAEFISATGGTITTSGDFKTHIFTGDGSFVVATVGNPVGSDTVSYAVVAGGGGGGSGTTNNAGSGGGGAGGLRTSPAFPVTATTYPVTVGGGGAAGPISPGSSFGADGTNSIFSTITSTGGGGGGGAWSSPYTGRPGGSGGGGGSGPPFPSAGGTGNTPPVSPPQGNDGGASNSPAGTVGGGGGGASAAGTTGSPTQAGNGGAGTDVTPIFGPGLPNSGIYAGGGGNGIYTPAGTPLVGAGGTGGGGAGGPTSTLTGNAGTTNTGGGGGGGSPSVPSSASGGAGGKGIVIIRYKFQ